MAEAEIPEAPARRVRMIAIDLDGTLLGLDGRVGPRNLAALRGAYQAGILVVVATGRRHFYALKVLGELGMLERAILVSSNGAVVRSFGSEFIERTLMPGDTARWLCGYLGEFRNALVITFDKVDANGEDTRGALVVEELEDLHSSIGAWMRSNEAYIERVSPIEDALMGDPPIQMMLCGTLDRMRRAEALMLTGEGVRAADDTRPGGRIALNRTEYPARDLALLDLLPAGCSKGAALLRLGETHGIDAAEIMAIGDNWNDLSMLEIAGFPVLMGNAPADLRTMASERGWAVTTTHDADGVAEAIDRALPHLSGEYEPLTVGGFSGSK